MYSKAISTWSTSVVVRKLFLRELSLLWSAANPNAKYLKTPYCSKSSCSWPDQTLPLVCRRCSSAADFLSLNYYIYWQQPSHKKWSGITYIPGMHQPVQGRSRSHLFHSREFFSRRRDEISCQSSSCNLTAHLRWRKLQIFHMPFNYSRNRSEHQAMNCPSLPLLKNTLLSLHLHA